ncbi:MAG: electron transport complex subunit RsxC [Hydrogenophilaceae bacterium]|nr:electron transport complex subunit RsxC [Hydrogenophilaceae bacterium]
MRSLHPFPGGVHPADHKAESNARPIAQAPLLPRYVVPLRQHIGTPAKPVVKAGDKVFKGQIIGQAVGYVSTAVHAPTSGRVIAIAPQPVPHPSGIADLAIVIESDGDDRAIEYQPLIDWRNMDPSMLRNRVRDLGLAGLGGAVFPSYIKLNPKGAAKIPTLILNGAECEPWITCDDRLMRERAHDILRGTAVIQSLLHAEEILIGIEDNKPEAIAAMREASEQCGFPLEVVAVPTQYPAGGGKQLTYLLTGKETPSGALSSDIGVQVFNIGTAYSLYRAIEFGEPLISRVVTVTGHVAEPQNIEVRIGTPIADLIRLAGGELAGASGRLIGGPMMGFDLRDAAAPITKSVNCVIVKNPALFPPAPPPMPCIRCGECARACPVSLQPFEMYWYAKARDFGKTQGYQLFDCIECGCCSYVCPSHIPLVDYFRFAKSEIWAREREKQAAEQARTRHEFHQFREEREKQEKADKLAAKAAERLKQSEAAPATADPEAERKKAILQAAIERAQKAKEGVTPKNIDNVPAEVRHEIEEIEARRAKLREAAHAQEEDKE